MSVTSGFFNSLNGDRKYTAEQFSALIGSLITDGVFTNIGDAFMVSADSGFTINVGVGRAWFNNAWVDNDSSYPMILNDPEIILDRIDAIVIEVNHDPVARRGYIRAVYGTPSGSPVRPELIHTDLVNQYPLAYIYRPASSTTINQADITNMIGTSECPYVTGILETQDIDKMVAQWENEFTIWFEGLQDITEGDPMANLANRIIELESRFTTLAKDHAVYETLNDSSYEAIQDSTGSSILGRTKFLTGVDSAGRDNGPGIIPSTDPEDAFKIGDILTSVRVDLGENWPLCNGTLISAEKYPKLYALTKGEAWYKPAFEFLGPGFDSENVSYRIKPTYNNKFVIYRQNVTVTSDDFRILVIDPINAEIVEVEKNGLESRTFVGLDHNGEFWVMCIYYSMSRIDFYTSTDLKNWTLKYEYDCPSQVTISDSYGLTAMLFDGVSFRIQMQYNGYQGTKLITIDKDLTQGSMIGGYSYIFACEDFFLMGSQGYYYLYKPGSTDYFKASTYSQSAYTAAFPIKANPTQYIFSPSYQFVAKSIVIYDMEADSFTTISALTLVSTYQSSELVRIAEVAIDDKTDRIAIALIFNRSSNQHTRIVWVDRNADLRDSNNYIVDPIPYEGPYGLSYVRTGNKSQSIYANYYGGLRDGTQACLRLYSDTYYGEYSVEFSGPGAKFFPYPTEGAYTYIKAKE